jgi:feruloyl-CoA synthase
MLSNRATPASFDGRMFMEPAVTREDRSDGSVILRSAVPLQRHSRCVGDWLEHWAARTPDRLFLCERPSITAPWATVSYCEARRLVRSAAAWILKQGMSAERPLAILSDNSIEHALFALAAMHVGVPAAAISPAYSLVSKDFDKLKNMVSLLNPGAIYVSSAAPYASALSAIRTLQTRCQHPMGVDNSLRCVGRTRGKQEFCDRLGRNSRVSQQAKAQTWPFLEKSGLVLLDWLPWSHTFGANHNFNLVLRNGGTLYIDGGKPAPGQRSGSQ